MYQHCYCYGRIRDREVCVQCQMEMYGLIPIAIFFFPQLELPGWAGIVQHECHVGRLPPNPVSTRHNSNFICAYRNLTISYPWKRKRERERNLNRGNRSKKEKETGNILKIRSVLHMLVMLKSASDRSQ